MVLKGMLTLNTTKLAFKDSVWMADNGPVAVAYNKTIDTQMMWRSYHKTLMINKWALSPQIITALNFICIILMTQTCPLIREGHFYRIFHSTVKIRTNIMKGSNSTNCLSTFDVIYMYTAELQMTGQDRCTRRENANRSSCTDNKEQTPACSPALLYFFLQFLTILCPWVSKKCSSAYCCRTLQAVWWQQEV